MRAAFCKYVTILGPPLFPKMGKILVKNIYNLAADNVPVVRIAAVNTMESLLRIKSLTSVKSILFFGYK